MKLGTENRNQLIAAGVLGVFLVGILVYQFMPSSSTIASTTPAASTAFSPETARPAPRRPVPAGKKEKAPQSLDPTLHLEQLAWSEKIKYEGSGRNIFISQAEDIPKPLTNGIARSGSNDPGAGWQPPTLAAPPAIPLKFFGFANQPGEPKKVFLSKGEDVFIAGEGEIVDRRYKVVHISSGSVEIQDVVGSGPPQTVPLTQG